jgi:hypothetical protein
MLYPCILHLHIPFGQLGPLFKEKEKKRASNGSHYHPFILPFEDFFFSCENGVYDFFK